MTELRSIGRALLAVFRAPSRLIDNLAARAEVEIDPPTDFVGMCRCRERLITDTERSLGECANCAARWW